MNRICLMGRLTADPELKTTQSGLSVTTFAIAVKRRSKEDTADFIDITAWRQTAEFITRYFTKGQMIAVEGTLQTRSYTDKNGNKRKAVEVVADNVDFCGSKQQSQDQNQNTADVTVDEFDFIDTPDEELPF